MKEAQIARINKVLNTHMRYEEGVMSRKQWLNIKKRNGFQVRETEQPKYKWDRLKYNRMDHWEQREYDKKMQEKKPSYEIFVEGERSYYEITKIEYDYFKTL